MHKTAAIIFLALVPSLSFAHSSNDLSAGHAHWLFSLHHLLGMVVGAAIIGTAIWYFTKPKPQPRKAKVEIRDDDRR